jgi:hypothetical protein
MVVKRWAWPLVVTTYERLWADDEADALIRELYDIIASDHYQLSPRILTLKAILANLRPEPVRETLPPREVYVRPRAPAARRHPAGPVAQTQKLCNQRCYMHVG